MPHKTVKKKLVLKDSVKIVLSKVLITAIIFLIGMISLKQFPTTRIFIEKNIFTSSFKFTKIKDIYNKYFGKLISIDKIMYEETPVFNETITYTEKHAYKDGVALSVSNNYMVPALENGIVVYIGTNEQYGPTIIIEQENGIDTYYSNITTSLKLYDYIEKGEYIGQTTSDKLYLIFQKDGKRLDYQKYI